LHDYNARNLTTSPALKQSIKSSAIPQRPKTLLTIH